MLTASHFEKKENVGDKSISANPMKLKISLSKELSLHKATYSDERVSKIPNSNLPFFSSTTPKQKTPKQHQCLKKVRSDGGGGGHELGTRDDGGGGASDSSEKKGKIVR